MRQMSISDFSGMYLFVEAGRRKTLSAAAEALSLPVSSLSRRLMQFERCVGIHLIDRTTRRFRLTTAGLEHFNRCEKVIDDARLAHGALQRNCDGMEGPLTLVATSDEAAMVVANQITRFTTLFPKIALTIEVVDSMDALEASPFELAIHFGPTGRESMITRRVLDMPWALVASSAYLRRRPAPVDIDRLGDHQFITGTAMSPAMALCERGGDAAETRVPESIIRATKPAVALSMALAGAGIAIMPLCMVEESLRTGTLQLVHGPWSLAPQRLCVIMKSRLLSARSQALADALCGPRAVHADYAVNAFGPRALRDMSVAASHPITA